jgi:glycosyltransferase involved in cell wall biosynthesis
MLEDGKDKVNVVFIHGRPSGHPIHMEYAKLLNADFHFEDYHLQWLDIESAGKIRRYISWVINSFFFPNKKKYDVFFCECLRVPPLIMKKIGLMRPNQKLIALMADESLYFLDKRKYSWLTRNLIKSFLNSCDTIFCIGDLQYDLAIKHTKTNNHKNILKIYNGISPDLQIKLNSTNRISDKIIRLLVIANLSTSWRSWYKGVDIAIAAFVKVASVKNNIELGIIGEVNNDVKKDLLKNVPTDYLSKIHFMGSISKLDYVLDSFDLCIHVSRGDAFPTSTLESMSAGIPVILSTDTGTKCLVEIIERKLVVEVDIEQTCHAIMYYINLSDLDKLNLRMKVKDVVKDYNSIMTNRRFKELFYSEIKI